MSNGAIVVFDGLIIANLLALAFLLCADLARIGRVIVGALILISCGMLWVLTLGDIAIWFEGLNHPQWFMDRSWRAGWRAPLGITLTVVNVAILSIHRGTRH